MGFIITRKSRMAQFTTAIKTSKGVGYWPRSSIRRQENSRLLHTSCHRSFLDLTGSLTTVRPKDMLSSLEVHPQSADRVACARQVRGQTMQASGFSPASGRLTRSLYPRCVELH